MEEIKDIMTLDDIKTLVNVFYEKVRQDELLAPIFNERIKDRWPEHLEKMVRFWQTVLLQQHTYDGSPFYPHVNLPVKKLHFDTWLKLWSSAIEDHFSGQKANEAKWRGDKMAILFLSKIEYYKTNSASSLL